MDGVPEGFVYRGRTTGVQYVDGNEFWDNGNIIKAYHMMDESEHLSHSIVISKFKEEAVPHSGRNNYLVYVLDEEIYQVVNLLKLLRSGGSNE